MYVNLCVTFLSANFIMCISLACQYIYYKILLNVTISALKGYLSKKDIWVYTQFLEHVLDWFFQTLVYTWHIIKNQDITYTIYITETAGLFFTFTYWCMCICICMYILMVMKKLDIEPKVRGKKGKGVGQKRNAVSFKCSIINSNKCVCVCACLILFFVRFGHWTQN